MHTTRTTPAQRTGRTQTRRQEWQAAVQASFSQTFFSHSSAASFGADKALEMLSRRVLPPLQRKDPNLFTRNMWLANVFAGIKEVFRVKPGQDARPANNITAERLAPWLEHAFPAILHRSRSHPQFQDYVKVIHKQMALYARSITSRQGSNQTDRLSNEWGLLAAALIRTGSVMNPEGLEEAGRQVIGRISAAPSRLNSQSIALNIARGIGTHRVTMETLLSITDRAISACG